MTALEFNLGERRFRRIARLSSLNAVHEQARGCLQDNLTDDEGLRACSPATAARYESPCKDSGADKPFDRRLEGVSLGGERVALLRFDHENLQMDSNEMADTT